MSDQILLVHTGQLFVFCGLSPSLHCLLAWNLTEAEFFIFLKYPDQIPATGLEVFKNTSLKSMCNYKAIN